MKIEINYTWREKYKVVSFTPILAIHHEAEEGKERITSIILFWIIAGISIDFKKTPEQKEYATCIQPIPNLLTRNKDYQIIKTVGLSYVVKRDDDSIDRISKTRFTKPFLK
jgi:hypothetical protein